MTYKFCPICKGETEQKRDNLFICKECGQELYINPAPTTAAIIENSKGEILMAVRKFEPKKGLLDLPGGFIEPGESLEEGTIREIKEELNVELSDLKYFASFPDDYLYKDINYKIEGITFTGKISEDAEITPSDDIAEAKFYKKEDIPLDQIAFKNIRQALEDYLKR